MAKQSSTERVRVHRERKRIAKLQGNRAPKKVKKTPAQRMRDYRERKRLRQDSKNCNTKLIISKTYTDRDQNPNTLSKLVQTIDSNSIVHSDKTQFDSQVPSNDPKFKCKLSDVIRNYGQFECLMNDSIQKDIDSNYKDKSVSNTTKCNVVSTDDSSSSDTSLCVSSVQSTNKIKLKTKVQCLENELKKAEETIRHITEEKRVIQQILETPVKLDQFKLMCEQLILNQSSCNFVKTLGEMFSISDNENINEKRECFALMIHFFGPNVHQFLKKTLCLPTIKTLQTLTTQWEIGVGLNDLIFKLLSLKGNTMTKKSKECILCATEIPLKRFFYYNYYKDEIVGFYEDNTLKKNEIPNKVLILMIRGLHDSWKQPLAYFFISKSYTSNSLRGNIFHTIHRLSSISFDVKILISDLGFNFKMFTDIEGISTDKPYFNVGKSEITYIINPSCLLKATYKNFVKFRFQFNNSIFDFKHLKAFYDVDKLETYRLAPELSDSHMSLNKFKKIKIKQATQVFNKSVVIGMKSCLKKRLLSTEAIDTVDFIDLMHKLYNLFHFKPKSKKKSSAYNLYSDPCSDIFLDATQHSKFQIQENYEFLDIMFNYFKNLKLLTDECNGVINYHNSTFIDGWMLSIAGLKHLYSKLSSNSNNLIYIDMYRLNEDCFESFLDKVQVKNNKYINPTCIKFKRTFKKLFCNYYLEYFEDTKCLNDIDCIMMILNKISSEELTEIFPNNNYISKIQPLPMIPKHYRPIKTPEVNAIAWLCGHLMNKCLKIHTCDVCIDFAQTNTTLSRHDFINNLEIHEDDLTIVFFSFIASDSIFYRFCCDINLIFNDNFKSLSTLPNVGQTLKQCMINNVYFKHPCQLFPKDYLLNLFIRYRIYSSLMKTNKNLNLKGKKNKTKGSVKIYFQL